MLPSKCAYPNPNTNSNCTPLNITNLQPPPLHAGAAHWSADGRFLATRDGALPGAAWVWDLRAGDLAAVLQHIGPIRAMAWAPGSSGSSSSSNGGVYSSGGGGGGGGYSCNRLAIVTGGGRLYLWSPAGASVVHAPAAGFKATGVAWAPACGAGGGGGAGGGALLLHGPRGFCCAYVSGAQ